METRNKFRKLVLTALTFMGAVIQIGCGEKICTKNYEHAAIQYFDSNFSSDVDSERVLSRLGVKENSEGNLILSLPYKKIELRDNKFEEGFNQTTAVDLTYIAFIPPGNDPEQMWEGEVNIEVVSVNSEEQKYQYELSMDFYYAQSIFKTRLLMERTTIEECYYSYDD